MWHLSVQIHYNFAGLDIVSRHIDSFIITCGSHSLRSWVPTHNEDWFPLGFLLDGLADHRVVISHNNRQLWHRWTLRLWFLLPWHHIGCLFFLSLGHWLLYKLVWSLVKIGSGRPLLDRFWDCCDFSFHFFDNLVNSFGDILLDSLTVTFGFFRPRI